MVTVAKGMSEKEAPMLFKIPESHDANLDVIIEVCQLGPNYAMLGFGDVIIPGVLLGFLAYQDFALNYDYRLKKFRVFCFGYYLLGNLGYWLGMILTFVVLMLMESGQPALFYIVP